MSFTEHLGELRRRLIVSGVVLVVAAAGAFAARDWIFSVILRPLALARGGVTSLVTLSPAEPFLTVLSVSLYVGLVAASPVIIWEILGLCSPRSSRA